MSEIILNLEKSGAIKFLGTRRRVSPSKELVSHGVELYMNELVTEGMTNTSPRDAISSDHPRSALKHNSVPRGI